MRLTTLLRPAITNIVAFTLFSLDHFQCVLTFFLWIPVCRCWPLIRLTNIHAYIATTTALRVSYLFASRLPLPYPIQMQTYCTCMRFTETNCKKNEEEAQKRRPRSQCILFSFSLFSITSSAPSPSKQAKQQSHIFQISTKYLFILVCVFDA